MEHNAILQGQHYSDIKIRQGHTHTKFLWNAKAKFSNKVATNQIQ